MNRVKQNRGLPSVFRKTETLVFLLTAALLVLLLTTTENFRDADYIIKAVSRNVEFGLIALTMTLIIIAGQIDLSVASIMTLASTVTAMMFHDLGVPMEMAIIAGLATGFVLGFFNGVLVAYAEIPPLIATIGTMSLYRGIAQIAIGDNSLGNFPKWFNSVDRIYAFSIGNAKVPFTPLGLLVVTIIMFLIMRYTTTGRKIYAIGTNERAVKYVGVDVKRFKMMLFAVNGLFCAAAGLLAMSRLLVVRHDMALGGELDIITIVMLGGTSILGGKGSVIGTFFGLLMVVLLRSGLSVAGVKVDQQLFALGAVLLIAIVVPELLSLLKERRLDRISRRDFDTKAPRAKQLS